MFKISPIQSKEEQQRFAAACGATSRDGLFAYGMTDAESGEIMGFSQFEIEGDLGIITDLCPAVGTEDYEAMFILGRQTMNFIDLCGAHTARAICGSGESRLLHAIGFREDGDGWLCDMTGYFDGHCDGHAVELK